MKLSTQQLKEIVAQYVVANKIAQDSFTPTKDNIVGALDKIAKMFTLDNLYNDKLATFDGEQLPFGKTLEEWQQDLILPADYDAEGANALAPTDPTYRPVSYSYTLGRKYIPTTIRNDNIERACNNAEEAANIIAMQSKRLYDSETYFRYETKKEIFAKLIHACDKAMTTGTTFNKANSYTVNTYLNDGGTAKKKYGVVVKPYTGNTSNDWSAAVKSGYIVELDLTQQLAIPTDTASGEAFIKQVKKDVESADFIHEGHSLNGNTLGATYGLVLLVKKGVIPSVEVDVMAGVFQEQRVAIPAEIIIVDDFGSDTTKTYAMLVDRRAIRLHNTYKAVRENMNGKGDFLNLFLHTENTAFYSRNTFVKVYQEV